MVKFVDTIPDRRPGGNGSLEPIRRELRQKPNVWAEVARYAAEEMSRASGRANTLRNKGDSNDIESTVRIENGEAVVYARAVVLGD